MSSLAASSAALMAVGGTVTLSGLRWFRQTSLTARLARPSSPPAGTRRLGNVLASAAAASGSAVAALLGSDPDLEIKLARAGAAQSPEEFRSRQFCAAAGAFVTVAVALTAMGAAPAVVVAIAMGSAAATFGVFEHQLARAVRSRRMQIIEELPIVAEQIGMLLASGLSLTSALDVAAQRGSGICATDLRQVTARVVAGTGVETALAEWADGAGSAEIRRFIGVLTLHEETADVASLVSDEARSARMEVHRQLISLIERRSEQVWIPVTVAALVPGAVLLAIPFSDALRGYAAL